MAAIYYICSLATVPTMVTPSTMLGTTATGGYRRVMIAIKTLIFSIIIRGKLQQQGMRIQRSLCRGWNKTLAMQVLQPA